MHTLTGDQSSSSAVSSTVSFSEEVASQDSHQPTTYSITGDNIDKTINPRLMSMEHQRQSIHFFHSYAVLDRVNCIDLPYDHLIGDVTSLPVTAFLPSMDDCKVLRSNYATILGRILVKKIPYFSKFKDCVTMHIAHQYSDEMKKPSKVVSPKCST